MLPFWFAWILPPELQILLVFRVIRFLKLGRYSPAMRSLLDALYAERRALIGCFVILIGAALLMATLMHVIEGKAQPDKFGTIPDAMWWAIATLGTIGYGDVVPVTPLGRMLATCTIFLGLIMVALPVGIVATAFASDIHRREFIVTWGMVARVPLFAGLDAKQIAEIMRLLQSQRDRGRHHHRAARRTRAFHVFRGRRRGRDRPCPSAAFVSARAISSARSRCCAKARRSATVRAPHPHQPARPRCPRRPHPDGSGAQDRPAHPGDGPPAGRTGGC